MTGAQLHLVLPGSLGQRTGGTIYDRRIVEELRRAGRIVAVHGLDGRFPEADDEARASLASTLAAIPSGATVIIDGLAMGGLPGVVALHRDRLHQVALVHQVLADEPGLEPTARDRLLALERDALAATRGVIVTSAFSAARVRSLGVDPARIRIVPPGTDRAPRAVGPGLDAPPRLLCVASVTPGKGQDVLVAALARVAGVPWSCVCAGSLDRAPDFALRVQGSVHDAGLSGRVEFPGDRDGEVVAALYRSSSIFVLASHYESYGMALTEAMASGLPIVSTTAGAIPETVPADAGLLVPPGDAGALADALLSLLVDAPGRRGRAAELRSQLGRAGRRHASTLPDRRAAAMHFQSALSELGWAVPALTRSPSGSTADRGSRSTY